MPTQETISTSGTILTNVVDYRVYNQARTNATIHWHGISQYGSPFSDGTPSAAQWPIPPGKYFDYEFKFDNDVEGTFWYHSHVGVGTLLASGPLIVRGRCGRMHPPIPYDEERIVMFHDIYDGRDEDLIAVAK